MKYVENNKNLLVCVSGGRSSSMMAWHIFTNEKYKDFNKLFVFCNTGQERSETIQFLKDMVKFWGLPLVCLEGVYSQEPKIGVKSKIVPIDNLNMTSEPFKGAILQLNKNKNFGVPHQGSPYCSDYLKTRVAHDYARQYFGTTTYIKALGYRGEDMPKRITFAELNEDKTIIAPLLQDFKRPIFQSHLTEFFAKQPFKLELDGKLGNCQLCYKKSTKNLIESIKYGVTCIDFYTEMEAKYSNKFFREKLSIIQLVELSKLDIQINLFEDIGGDCVCNFK